MNRIIIAALAIVALSVGAVTFAGETKPANAAPTEICAYFWPTGVWCSTPADFATDCLANGGTYTVVGTKHSCTIAANANATVGISYDSAPPPPPKPSYCKWFPFLSACR